MTTRTVTRRKLLEAMIKRYVKAKAVGYDGDYAIQDLNIYLRTRFNINLLAWYQDEMSKSTSKWNPKLADVVPEEELSKTIEAVKWCCINSGVVIKDLFKKSNNRGSLM